MSYEPRIERYVNVLVHMKIPITWMLAMALSGEHDSSLTSLHIQCPIACGYSNELRVKQRPASFMRNSLAGDVTQNVRWRRDASSWLSFMTHL